jgi:O-antigen ligase
LVWEKARLYISLRPIFGYGVEAASTTIVKTSAMHMHNIYLNNLYFGGVLSFIVFIFLLLITAIRIDKYKMHLIASIIIIGLGSFLIAMQTEVYIRNPIFYVLLMLSFHMSKIAPIKIKRPLRRTFSEVEYGNE